MSYQGYGTGSGQAGPSGAAGPASPMRSASSTASIMPPHASSMTLPMAPRSSVPGYIRRTSNMPSFSGQGAGMASPTSPPARGGAVGMGIPGITPRAPETSATMSSLRSGSVYPSSPAGTPHPIGSSYLPSMLAASGGNAGAAGGAQGQGAGGPAAMTPSGSKSGGLSAPSNTDGYIGNRVQGQGPDVLDRPRDRTKTAEVSASALAFLFAEIVSYTQNRVLGISDLERKLSLLGYRVGQRVLPLLMHRIEFPTPPSLGSGSSVYNRTPKRETRLLPVLLWLHSQLWKALFGRQADSLERSTEKSDEYMISTNNPLFARSMSVPREMSQLSVESFTAGIVEAALDGMGFPARVTAHSVPTPDHPLRTTILVKLSKEVMEREEALGPA